MWEISRDGCVFWALQGNEREMIDGWIDDRKIDGWMDG